ncbi:MAG: NBR1-Ig-like domain-containing protein [Anaerolineae bacterium]
MVHHLRKAILLAFVLSAVLAACAPAQSPASQNEAQVGTAVAATVQSQGNQIAAAVFQTLTAQAPVATPTTAPTLVTLALSTSAPAATVTPFVVVPPSGGSGGGATTPQYACTWREVKPRINVFKPGDPIDIVWIITNTGTRTWPSKLDLDYVSGTKISPFMGQELPPLKPGDSTTVSFEGNAPQKPGLYGEQYKVQGGLCFPALNIEVRRPPDP